MIPQKAHPTDVAYDLTAIEKYYDELGNIVYDTKISISIPEGYGGFLLPRSSISKYALALSNSVGTIDPGYTGSLILKFKPAAYLDKRSDESPFEYLVGDRVGQLIILPIPELEFEEVKELDKTKRGANGFGSTDKKV